MTQIKESPTELKNLRTAIHDNAKDKGFWDEGVGEIHRPLLLIVSEIGEAVEAHRKGNVCALGNDQLRDLFKLKGEEFEKKFKQDVKDTFEDELADTFIRLLDFMTANNINVEAHVLLKMKYNSTRERLHGKNY